MQHVTTPQDVPFPPRKMLRPEDPQYSSSHSPLSPLTPSSPLHPDGLIAPIWIRKHTTLVPSVFVVFRRIYESPPLQPGQDEREREAEEKRRDTELAGEIALRKKSTNERNIKLTAVLMASRKMLGTYGSTSQIGHAWTCAWRGREREAAKIVRLDRVLLGVVWCIVPRYNPCCTSILQ